VLIEHQAISQAEHRAIEDQLAVVLRTDTDGPDFGTEVKMLAATLHHHAGEEERLLFPQSHALGEETLEALGTQMVQRKRQFENSTVTQTLRRQSEKCCDACEPVAARALRLVR